MKYIIVFLLAVTAGSRAVAQQTRYYTDPQEKFKRAKDYFQKEQYSLAYPLFRELERDWKETDRLEYPVMAQEIDYYGIVCALKQNESRALAKATDFIKLEKNQARVEMMSFHLAEYYFRKEEFTEAIPLYEGVDIANLSNREIADMKFHQGYAYFTQQQFAQAKPLFASLVQSKDDPNYIDANYYYGFLSFRDHDYTNALSSFKTVESEDEYKAIVPYYIAQIYYIQGNKDQALDYAENKLKKDGSYYDTDMNKLLGHAYFEKGEYNKALPYLEAYVKKAEKVTKEDLYELSYCYYQADNLTNAIEGFKQLSGQQDSLSQHAMYLLGDAYLRTNQKANARNAFLFCASNSSNARQREISRFNYGKLSYELGFQDDALKSLRAFTTDYPQSEYITEARDLLVAVLANTNNYKDAMTLLEGMPAASENAKRAYPRVLYGRASELINDGRLTEADELLTKALKAPYNGDILPLAQFWKGEIAYRNDRLDDAIKYYQAYLTAGAPSSGQANMSHVRYNLGYCYLLKENYDAAIGFFEPLSRGASLSSDELTQDAYVRTADCYYMQRNYAKATAMYDNVIRFSWPAEDYATYQKAMIAGINNSTQKINLLKTLNRKFPSSQLALESDMEIANTYLASGQFTEAIPYLKNVIKNSGSEQQKPRAYLQLGLAYYNLDQTDEALNQYKTLINEYPNSPEVETALINVKAIYVDKGQTESYANMMRDLGRPLSVNTEDSLTYFSAEIQYEDGNNAAAMKGFDNYVQRFPNGAYYVNAQYFRGEIAYAAKDWTTALTGYEAVAAKSPNSFAEKAVLRAARLYFFEIKNYPKAEAYFAQLKQLASSQENKLESMRGLLRSQYLQEKWSDAEANAKDLLEQKGATADDKALAAMAIGKAYQIGGRYDLAISNFKTVIAQNKAALAAEARYETAACWLALDKLKEAETAGFDVIKKAGSYDFWVTKAYILLGDVYYREKDYFNAKATLQSVVENTINPDLKAEAQTILNKVIQDESKASKISG